MSGVGHTVTEQWMGESTETLSDLLRPALRAFCVGINPAPDSVRAGHYYQATAKKLFGNFDGNGFVPGLHLVQSAVSSRRIFGGD